MTASAPARTASPPARQSIFVTVPPLVLSTFSTAAVMYPIDLIKELRMGNFGGAPILELISKFRQTYGLVGFFTQGIAPEVVRAGWMRALKFFLFPLTHEALHGKPPSLGSARERAIAGALCTVPEAVTIMPLENAKIGLQLDRENRFKRQVGGRVCVARARAPPLVARQAHY